MRANKTSLTMFFSVLITIVFSFFTPRVAHAELNCWGPLFLLDFGGCLSLTVKNSFEDIDIERTVNDTAKAAAVEVPTNFATGRNTSQLAICAIKIRNEAGGEVITIPPENDFPDDDCSDLRTVSVMTGKYGYPTSGRSSGSLMGFATALQDITQNEPLPVNLAYYGKHMAAKIPVLNQTAFAQSPDDDPIGLKLVVGVWETLRNISYGVLAIFMVVIGIMVMMRQKINPQTVVTVQTAIPRVIIAVILITFSYPIASLAIQLIGPLSRMAIGIFQTNPIYASMPFSTVLILPILFGLLSMGPAGGLLAAVLVIIEMIVCLILIIKILFSVFVSYIKIIFSVLVAPLSFAWGAIPGNEGSTVDWFKHLAVNTLSVPAMFFGLGLAMYIAVEINLELVKGVFSYTGSGVGFFSTAFGPSFMGMLGVPLIILILLLQVGKIPQKLEEMILGREPYKKKGK